MAAADNVTFTIEPGGFVALTGASGSGKSTLLHLIGAIERPDSGTIISGGTEVTALRGGALAAYRRTVGFVFQRYNLLPALTALDNVIAPVLPYRTGWDKPDRGPPAPGRGRPRRPGAVAAVPDVRRRAAAGGHRPGADQHARTCCWPTSRPATWTPHNATGILDLLAGLRRENQMTVIIATHDPQIAARCDRLIRLRDGAVIDDIEIADGYPVEETIRRVGQLG